MKKRFSDEQIISILREAEAEAGVPARELCRKHAISDATFLHPGVRSMAVWRCLKLSA